VILLLTGPSGSGKTTVATLLARDHGWIRISEDAIWPELFGKKRGAFGSREHRRKRSRVHEIVFAQILEGSRTGRNVVIEATVHQAPPEAYEEYGTFFESRGLQWSLRVLYPRLEVAIARDAAREGWHLGPRSVAGLHAKFDGSTFDRSPFLDNSDEAPASTTARLLSTLSL
jgi:predicted kinase